MCDEARITVPVATCALGGSVVGRRSLAEVMKNMQTAVKKMQNADFMKENQGQTGPAACDM